MFSDVALLDGGLSTALEQLGSSLNTSLWSGELLKSHPDQIRAAHKLFADAGAAILITSSYQVTYPGCLELGWSKDEVHAALIASTELARFPNVKVAASVGPYGAFLADGSEYRGNYGLSVAELKEFHRERLVTLIATKPDYLAFETVPEITEARAYIELMQECGSQIPYWISFSCKSESELCSGESFADAVQIVSDSSKAFAVGINCTAPHLVAPLLQSAISKIPFIVYANSGRTWDATTKKWDGSGDLEFDSRLIQEWRALGASIIGGCCGVGPSDIAALGLISD
jgi:homocysteine S-methyltransferase